MIEPIIIQNELSDFILPRGFRAITFCPFIFVSTKTRLDPKLLQHELIHCLQQMELFWIAFFFLYLQEWVVNLLDGMTSRQAYHSISFEREAYIYSSDIKYLFNRPEFNWLQFR